MGLVLGPAGLKLPSWARYREKKHLSNLFSIILDLAFYQEVHLIQKDDLLLKSELEIIHLFLTPKKYKTITIYGNL